MRKFNFAEKGQKLKFCNFRAIFGLILLSLHPLMNILYAARYESDFFGIVDSVVILGKSKKNLYDFI